MTLVGALETINSMHTKSVALQGQKGSFHELVALQYYPDDTELLYCETFKEVFDRLDSGEAAEAVVAIANNRYGFVPGSFSQLMQRRRHIAIVGEFYLAVKHQLIGLPGATLSDIKEVHSMSVAIGQCESFLETKLANALLVEEQDTAYSAELIAKQGDKSHAAIASKEAADLYGLSVIHSDIQDDPSNITRFYIVTKRTEEEDIPHTKDANKTTAILQTHQSAGSLVDALLPFKKLGINITTLHSSFLPNTGFDMHFLIEFDLSLDDERATLLLTTLEKAGARLESLGSYGKSRHLDKML